MQCQAQTQDGRRCANHPAPYIQVRGDMHYMTCFIHNDEDAVIFPGMKGYKISTKAEISNQQEEGTVDIHTKEENVQQKLPTMKNQKNAEIAKIKANPSRITEIWMTKEEPMSTNPDDFDDHTGQYDAEVTVVRNTPVVKPYVFKAAKIIAINDKTGVISAFYPQKVEASNLWGMRIKCLKTIEANPNVLGIYVTIGKAAFMVDVDGVVTDVNVNPHLKPRFVKFSNRK